MKRELKQDFILWALRNRYILSREMAIIQFNALIDDTGAKVGKTHHCCPYTLFHGDKCAYYMLLNNFIDNDFGDEFTYEFDYYYVINKNQTLEDLLEIFYG